MHSVNRPSDEAQKLYVDQSCLATRLLRTESDAEEWVIWDVGLGAASNAMAAIACFEQTLATHGTVALRPLRIVSFECDLDPLRLALREPGKFPHIRHGAPHEVLKHGHWAHASGLLHWNLHKGDFLKFIETSHVPDVIFFDPFSAKTDTGLWTAGVFTRIAAHCSPKSAELYTYSAATAVRVALLTAGFFVAEGTGTGPKAATTAAFTRASGVRHHPQPPRLLDAEWLARWHRSSSKFPSGLTAEEKVLFEKRIESHPQFAR
jgi:queuine tRNA-ribosyltransferase